MKVISIKEKLKESKMEEIANALKDGKIVIFPTETIYGIGTSAFQMKSVDKIYEIKGRPEQKALIVLIANYQMLEDIAEISDEKEKELMGKFWPGALTIVLKRKENSAIPNNVTAFKDTIAVRMSDNEIIKKLIEKSGVPIVAPSANLSGVNNATKIEEILRDLGNKVDYVLDNGNIIDETPSTIVKVEEGKIKILREGKIKKEQLLTIGAIKESNIMV